MTPTPPADAMEAAQPLLDEFLEWLRQSAETFAFGARSGPPNSGDEARARGALDLALALRANKNAGLQPSWLDNNIAQSLDAFAKKRAAEARREALLGCALIVEDELDRGVSLRGAAHRLRALAEQKP